MMTKLALTLFITLPFTLFAQWDVLPDRMYADTLHFPFEYGVASGDPLPNGFVLWTRVSAEENPNLNSVSWRIATDSTFSNIVQSGAVTAIAENDWTVKLDISRLEPSTTYYYQFVDALDRKSAVGRTKTTPEHTVDIDHAKIAITSCSSIYSGYFNAYRRIAERDDLDLWIHLGDYIYDFVDKDEQVRVPEPAPIDLRTKEEFWQRHRYYLLDPDLRAVRQQQPIFAFWDNHDIYKKNEEDLIGSIEAFFNYLPIRMPQSNNPKRIYRRLIFGKLFNLHLIDIELWRNKDTISNSNELSLLGNEQYNWLTEVLSGSKNATWRIIGNQKLFSNWAVDHLTIPLPFGNGEVADPGAWDGFPSERARILNFLKAEQLDNNIVISGDIHLSVASDLVINPKDSATYDGATGEGAIGVEFVPGSISRGNVDEALGIEPNEAFNTLLTNLSFDGNPHQQYLDLFQHGYGLLDIKTDSVIAQFIYADKHEVTKKDTVWKTLVVKNGENHWQRPAEEAISAIPIDHLPKNTIKIFPNPSKDIFAINFEQVFLEKKDIAIYNFEGKSINQKTIIPAHSNSFTIDLSAYEKGIYFVKIQFNEGLIFQKLMKL